MFEQLSRLGKPMLRSFVPLRHTSLLGADSLLDFSGTTIKRFSLSPSEVFVGPSQGEGLEYHLLEPQFCSR